MSSPSAGSGPRPGRLTGWLFVAAVAACTAALVTLVVRADRVTDTMAFLPGSPEVARFLEINRRYNNFNTVLIGVETSDLLAARNLTTVRDLTDAVSKVAGVSWVTSVTSMLDMQPSDEGVVVSPLVAEIPKDPAAAAALRARIQKARQVVGEMVSPDFTSALIVVTMYPDRAAETWPRVERLARAAASDGIAIHLHGAPAVESFLAQGAAGLPPWGGAAGALFLILLLVGLRPWWRIAAWVLVVAGAASAGMAAPALAGLAVSELSMGAALPALVLGTLAVASWPGPAVAGRLRRWRRVLLLACLGFAGVALTLLGSPVHPLRGLGAGLAAAAAVIGLLAPTALRVAARLAGAAHVSIPRAPERSRCTWLLAALPAAGAAAVVALSPRPAAFNDLSEMLDRDAAPLQATRFLDTRFGGSEYLTVVADGDLAHPGFLRTLDDLATAIRAVPGVAGVTSPSDIFKMIGEAMVGQYRIPDTIGQLENLWFFLEGQPELSALLKGREQGLLQIRLSPEGARRSTAVCSAIRERIAAAPSQVGLADLRLVPPADMAARREAQLTRTELALRVLLGPAAAADGVPKRIRAALGSAELLELPPALPAPEPAARDAFRVRLSDTLRDRLSAYFGGPSAPLTPSVEEIGRVAAVLAPGAGASRAAELESLVRGWFPDNERAVEKLSGILWDTARDAQDRALAGFVVDALGPVAEDITALRSSPELIGVLRDFSTPVAVVDASAAGVEAVTETRFDLTGYPVIAPVVAAATYGDLTRWGLALAALLLVLTLAGALAGGGRVALAWLAGGLVLLAGVAWQIGWIRIHTWALNLSSFLPLAVALAAAAGTGLAVAAGTRRTRDLAWGAMIGAAPLAVVAGCGFAPVRTVTALCAAGIAGAALAAWGMRTVIDVRETDGREERS